MLSIRSFKVFQEFDSFTQFIDFPVQFLGLWGANTKLINKKSKAIIDTNKINNVILKNSVNCYHQAAPITFYTTDSLF